MLEEVYRSLSPRRLIRGADEAEYSHLGREDNDEEGPHGAGKATAEDGSFSLAQVVSQRSLGLNVENFPESIYGAGMCLIVLSSTTRNHRVHGLSFLICLIMLANIGLQTWALVGVKDYITAPAVVRTQSLYKQFHDIAFEDGMFSQQAFESWDSDKKAEICQIPLSHPLFTLLILSIWTMSVVIEVKQTVHFVIWWISLPSYEDDVALSKGVADDKITVVQAASHRMKALVLSTILVPKLAIALFLWWMGARWLLATTDFEGLILNTVALSFIVELDEMIYMAVVPHNAKKILATFQIEVPLVDTMSSAENTDRRLLKWMCQIVIKSIIIAGVPIVYISKGQRVLPEYKWDVHRPCLAYHAAGHYE